MVPFSSGVRSALRAIFVGMVSAADEFKFNTGTIDDINRHTTVIEAKQAIKILCVLLEFFAI